MQISNRINSVNFTVQNNGNITNKSKIPFKGIETASSSEALSSLGKAKIAMDGKQIKPIPYEEKIRILKEKNVDEESCKKILRLNDTDFLKIIDSINFGLEASEVVKAINEANEINRMDEYILEFMKLGMPFDSAKTSLEYSYSGESKTRIEYVLKLKPDFSPEKELFGANDNDLYKIIKREDIFEKFTSLIDKGIDPNIAINAAKIDDSNFEKLKETMEEKSELDNNAKCAYFLKRISPEKVQKIIDISKKHNLDFNNYEFWIKSLKTKSLDDVDKYLQMGVPVEDMEMQIFLDDEKVKEAVSYAKKHDVSPGSIIFINQRQNDEEKAKIACDLFINNDLPKTTVCSLSEYEEPVRQEMVKYISSGINFHNAKMLALLDKDDAYKAKVIKYLDLFKMVHHVVDFLEMNLSKEDEEKFLDLIKRGANSTFANYCLKSKVVYDEALSLSESKICDLSGLYIPYNEEEFLRQSKLIKLGVPKSNSTYHIEPKEIKLLEAGVKYDDLQLLKDAEEKGQDTSLLKTFMKKGLSFKDANTLKEQIEWGHVTKNSIMDNIHPNMKAWNILTLACIQDEKGADWHKGKDKNLIIDFMNEIEKPIREYDDFKKLLDSDCLNEKALKNYKELKKRGIDKDATIRAIILSQTDFKNSSEYDNVVELLKRNKPFINILLSKDDENEFAETLKSDKNPNRFYENININITLAKCANLGCNKKDLETISDKCNFWDENKQKELIEYIQKGISTENAIKIADYSYIDVYNYEQKNVEKTKKVISELLLKGCDFKYLKHIAKTTPRIEKVKEFIDEGINPNLAEKMVLLNINPNNKKQMQRVENLQNSTINEGLKKASGNPALHPFIDKIFDFKNFEPNNFKNLFYSSISSDDIEKSGKLFIKSPLKQAMKRPNLYLSGIPVEDTEKINGEYPKLSGEKLKNYQNRMLDFFQANFVSSMRALKYLDVDTYNQMMDKRTTGFREQLGMLDKMNDSHYNLVSKITKCKKSDGKALSSKEKIDLAKIVLYHQLGYLDISYLEKIAEEGNVDVDELNKIIFNKLMIETIGLTPKELEDNKDSLDFDKDYMYLLLRTQASTDFLDIKDMINNPERLENVITGLEELLNESPEDLAHNGFTEESCRAYIEFLKNAQGMDEKELYKKFVKISPFTDVGISAQELAKISILHDFKKYITDENTKFGKINKKTQEAFKKANLDYDKWLNYSKKSEIEFNGHKFKIGLWDRYPQKDMFMGNRTSCCTAVIEGCNGKATPIYLTNTAFNVVQLKDENGNIVAMSRIFVGKVDKKPAMVVENIEINSGFLKNKTDEEKNLLRNKMFEYINDFGKAISNNKEMKTYFATNYTNLPTDDLEKVEKTVEFVGDISCESIYFNYLPGWGKLEKIKEKPCKLYEIR